MQQTGDPGAAQQLAWQALESLRHQQASTFAYFDVFLMLTVVTLGLVPVCWAHLRRCTGPWRALP